MPSNQAAWITEKYGKPLVVREAPYTSPSGGDIVIKNAAVAINPVDWKIQEAGYFIETFPNILGCDVAGEVVEVGSDVKDFKKGDRVLGHCPSLLSKQTSQSGFQLYTNIPAALAAPIPSSMSFSSASVLPLGISTAAAGLYQKDHLNLAHPQASGAKSQGQTLLVWGGSSSVGSCAIQLAVHSGYEVFTTASKHNFEYVKSLGASQVFDHTASTVVDDVVKALQGKTLAGIYDSISLPSSLKPSIAIAEQAQGNKFIATTLPGEGNKDVKVNGVFAITILHNEVGGAVYKDFLPEALKTGSFKAKPDPLVLGKGLEKIQEGLDKLKNGVSAGKVVIEL